MHTVAHLKEKSRYIGTFDDGRDFFLVFDADHPVEGHPSWRQPYSTIRLWLYSLTSGTWTAIYGQDLVRPNHLFMERLADWLEGKTKTIFERVEIDDTYLWDRVNLIAEE